MGSQPVVLIARLDDARALYAVERDARGLYAILRLGSWVDLQQLSAAAVVSKQDLSRAARPPRASSITQALPMAPESSTYSKKKRLAIEAIQSMVKRPSNGMSTEPTPTESQLPTSIVEPLVESGPTEELGINLPFNNAAPPTANEIFETIRNQYFEALYLSKVYPALTMS